MLFLLKIRLWIISSPDFPEDFYVHKNGFNNALDKDLVVFSIVDFYGNIQEMILNKKLRLLIFIQRNLKVLVGELKERKDKYYIDVDNPQISKINIIDNKDASIGDIVKVEIVDYKKNL